MSKNETQIDMMTKTPVEKLIIRLSVPTVVSMLVAAIYNSADTYFVSRIGTSASGAVGVVFSLMAVIQAVGFTIGMGSGSIISRLFGKRDFEEASKVASSALFSAMIFGLLLIVSMIFKVEFFMALFGATKTIMPHAVDYGRFIILGAPFMMGAYVLNNILRCQGKAKYAMIGLTTGGILNVFLDPLFIFTFKLGTAGASIATMVSQAISFSILLSMFLRGKSDVKLNIKKISPSLILYWNIFVAGLPSLARQGFSCIASMLLNRSAGIYGDSAVAAMSIVGKVFMMIFSIMIGIAQGFQPVCGVNYGAKNFKRVKRAFFFTICLSLLVVAVIGIPTCIFAKDVMSWFTKDDLKVIEIGKVALRAQCIAIIFVPLSNVTNMTLQMTGKSWTSTLLSCMRQGIFFIPLIILLPRFFGIAGIQYTQAAADVLATIFSIPFGIAFLKSIKEKA